MKRLYPLIVYLFLISFYSDSMCGEAKQGRLDLMDFQLDTQFLHQTNIPSKFYRFIPPRAQVGIYYPKQYTAGKTYPLFVALFPGVGNFISGISTYQRFADELGFIVTAENIDAKSDEEAAPRYYYILATIDHLEKQGSIKKQPVWIGGFSGGAKWAMHLGAFGGDRFSAVLAIGCNDDFSSYGYNELPNRSAFAVPLYLLNGAMDHIAGPQDQYYKEMLVSLRRTGFKNVTATIFDGGHEIPYRETRETFKLLMKAARSR